MSKLIGLDVGYGFVKITDGESGYSFPSVVGEGHTQPTFSTRGSQVHPIDDLKVEMGGKLFYVGKAAVRQSKYVVRDLSRTRDIGNDFEVLFFSALSLFCNNRTSEFRVVTGLPVDRIHLAENFEKRVRGEHNLKVSRGRESRDLRIYVSEVEIVPQPLGSYWSEFLPLDSHEDVSMDGTVGTIDIGFRTTDLAAMEDGEYIPEKSKTLLVGLSTAYSEVSSKLAIEYGVEKEDYALDKIVINRQISLSGKTIDISHIIEEAFEKLATNILVEINSLWRIADLEHLVLTGGGGQALSGYLMSQFPQARLARDPITANCRGYLAWGHRLWHAPDSYDPYETYEEISNYPNDNS
ncbi:MAG: ParM/StbA family protein [Clostridia bacterium]|jgi:plasmid segregation protein ParM|nr:ParM/StbA family protein [Clostridia bacterium]